MFSEPSLFLNILYGINVILMSAFSIGLPLLCFASIYKKKYSIKAELLSWKHDKYSSKISCDIGITRLSKPPFLVNAVYIKPAYSSSAFSKRRYIGDIEKGNFPVFISTLQKRKISVSFPIDLSSYYDINKNISKANKQWLLILKTNRLERAFRIDAPFAQKKT